MSWTAPSRSAEAGVLYEAAEADRRARPERYVLGPGATDAVVARALRGRDPADLGDEQEWSAGLAAFLASADEDGRLNALGERTAFDTAVGKLRARMAIADHDDIADDLSSPPIVIVGGWRTGTTFLFRLLATDPRLRAPLPAELTAPWRFVGIDDDARESRLDAAGVAHDALHLLNPTLAAVHDSGARLPEECVLAMGTDFRSWGFSSTMRLDGYSQWLANQDLAGEYARYRRVLSMLDRRDGRRWVLKAPAHTAELPHVARTFPGAVVVHLHRDIVETIASGASLFATFRSTYSDEVDGADVGRFLTDQTELWLRRANAFGTSAEADLVTVLHVRYTDLVADPVAVLDRIWRAADLEPLAHPSAFVDAFDAAQPRHAKGTHRYSPADFGIDERAVRERFADLEPPS